MSTALQIHAGPRALLRLKERGLSAADVRVIPAAAGGPKGLALLPLDRFIFGHWLAREGPAVHLLGASIGSWRMALACLPNADAEFAQLAEDYITQDYPHRPGRMPTAATVSQVFGERLQQRLGERATQILNSPRYRLHVFASRGRQILSREGRLRTPLGYLGAFVANMAGRRALGAWLERVVFSDPREALPFALGDYRSTQISLTSGNLAPAVLASCSVPFALKAVHDVPGGPRGAYWDGGITDYHLHLNYAAMSDGLVLYPHFQAQVVPGWLDKAWKRRHRSSAALDNLVLLSPRPEWVARLPQGKLPDRSDFKTYGERREARMRDWRGALAESQRLADEFAEIVSRGGPVHAQPLV